MTRLNRRAIPRFNLAKGYCTQACELLDHAVLVITMSTKTTNLFEAEVLISTALDKIGDAYQTLLAYAEEDTNGEEDK